MFKHRNRRPDRYARRAPKAARPIWGRRTKLHVESLEGRLLLSTFNVNSTADLLNPAPGVVTLRSAVEQANQTPGGDTINLTVPGTYAITLPGKAGETDNTAGEFAILPGGDLTITNTSGGTVVIDGSHLNRVFDINPNFDPNNPPPKFTVTLQGFTIQNGLAFDAANLDGPNSSGGGVRVLGNASLTLTNVVLTNNTATADGGGGVFENTVSTPWMLTVNGSTISNNHAGDAGGGIDTDGSGKIFINAGTVITGNTSVNQGAGIWLDAIQAGTVFQTANLTVTGAVVSNNSALAMDNVGGGIGNAGNGVVTVVGSTIANNYSGGVGGGIGDENAQGTLVVQNSLVQGNSAFGNGGGIAAGGPTATITSTEIKGNAAGGNGGGLFANGTTLTVLASTFAGNTTTGNGGALELEATGAGATGSAITDATFTANSALNNGGGTTGSGIDAPAAFTGSVALVNDTINANFATAVGGGVQWAGAAGSSFSYENTIISQNVAVTGGADANHVNGPFTDLGGNFIGGNPRLGQLQNNGGPTLGATGNTLALETESLLPGSPAIDAGLTGGAPTTDERGFQRAVNNKVDSGAYEFQPSATTTVLTSSANPGQLGQAVTLQATVTGNAPGSNTPTGTVTFSEGRRTLATVPLTGGVATLALRTLAPGNHRITAVYNGVTVGDFSFAPSTSAPLAEVLKGGDFAVAGSGRVQVRRISDGGLVVDFAPYPGYNGPISVAVGDVNGDGFPDIVTGAGAGNPDVRVFDGRALAQGTFNAASPNASLLAQWFAYGLQFNVGANVAVGDVNGDGFADVVTGASAGNPDVRVYSGKDIANHNFNPTGASLLAQVYAFGTSFNVGAFVAVGDVNGDGFGDVIVGASAGNPQVKVYDGQAIAQGHFNPTAGVLDQFFAYNSMGANQGVSVAAADFEGTGSFDILTESTIGPARYRVVRGNATGTLPPAVNGIDATATDITNGLSGA